MNNISVIIPVYNGERFIASAIESALAQTVPAREIIIVDDGSTDGTPAVVNSYANENLRVIRQANRGLAAARNAGVAAATGEFVAFLDSDDEWLPAFLETMLAMACANPIGDIFYCAAQCMDATGEPLPQLAGAKVEPPGEMYQTLLNANFLVPSTIMMKREVLVSVGGFDETRPVMQGCEDWDLWLRLAKIHPFVGTLDCLARYRLHEDSMSSKAENMERAVASVMEKHFGPDDGRRNNWSADKRLAYGGYYRFGALSAILRLGDWPASAGYLKKALEVNPELAADLDLFYELALGDQPLGYRNTGHELDLDSNATRLTAMLNTVFKSSLSELERLRETTFGTAYYALGLAAYNSQQMTMARRFLATASRYWPWLWTNRRFAALILKSFLNPALVNRLKGLKPQAALPQSAGSSLTK